MEKTYRDMACEDLQKTLHKLANDHRAIALALGQSMLTIRLK